MKRTVLMIVALVLCLSFAAFAAREEGNPDGAPTAPVAADKAPGNELKTMAEKYSYALGLEVGASLKRMEDEFDLSAFLRGVRNVYTGEKLLLTPKETAEVKQAVLAQRAARRKVLAEENRKDGKAFLAQNMRKEGVVTTASGLQYKVLREGDGPMPRATEKVKAHYSGTLINGTQFDSSYDRGEPATFQLDRVIPGWTEALQLMKVGSKCRLFIPSELAYGEMEAGPIPPNSVLIFDVELLGIEQ